MVGGNKLENYGFHRDIIYEKYKLIKTPDIAIHCKLQWNEFNVGSEKLIAF